MPESATPQMSQTLQRNLKTAGYSDIHIVPESFMIRARDKHGNPVMIVMTPDAMSEVVAVRNPATGAVGQQANAGGSRDAAASPPSGMQPAAKQ